MNDDELTVDDRVNIGKFLKWMNLFRDIDPNFRLGEAGCFLTVALNENMTVGEVARRTGRPMHSVSTYPRTLGVRARTGMGSPLWAF